VCRFLYHLSQYTKTPLTSEVQLVLDSQSLITRVTTARSSAHNNASASLQPEWDVINAIAKTLQIFPRQARLLKWEKSHQDDNHNYSTLGHSAQINCEADRLASSYYQHMLIPASTESPLEYNPVQFFIGHDSITSKYRTKIRIAAALPILRTYVNQRFKWDSMTATAIDWEIFSQIINHFPQQHITIVKHIHAIAPTGHIANRHQPSTMAQCPSGCGCDREDNNHVLTCPSESRLEWRTQTIEIVTEMLEQRSDPTLKAILQDGLQRFHNLMENMTEHNYPPEYHLLIRHQNTLGWDQLYRGRWSTQ